jgi:hypothetical protein
MTRSKFQEEKLGVDSFFWIKADNAAHIFGP